MATRSSILVWEIPWTEEPRRLQSMGSQKSWTMYISLCISEELYFQIVVLEKALESPLDCNEVTPVNPKGNKPSIFAGRTEVEYFGHLMQRANTLGKNPTHWKRP